MYTKFKILSNSNENVLCVQVSEAVNDLQKDGYTQIQFEYSTAYDSIIDAIVHSVLIVATKE